MNIATESRLKEHEQIFAKLENFIPNELKKKYRVGKMFHSHQHTCNHGGGKGKAARRLPGHRKHGKGPQNVSR